MAAKHGNNSEYSANANGDTFDFSDDFDVVEPADGSPVLDTTTIPRIDGSKRAKSVSAASVPDTMSSAATAPHQAAPRAQAPRAAAPNANAGAQAPHGAAPYGTHFAGAAASPYANAPVAGVPAPNIAPEQVQPGAQGAFVPAYSTKTGARPANVHNAVRGSSVNSAQPTTSDLARLAKRERNRKRRNIIIALILILALAYVGARIYTNWFRDTLTERIQGDVQTAQDTREALTPTVSTAPFYMMLIGSDSRNDDENERSDTNIVARIDPAGGIVNIISIPRDTAINLPGYGTVKFNAAYAYEGAPGAIAAAEGLLGIKIAHYAEIDFAGMVGLVDALGGVDIDVPLRIEDANAGDEVIEAGWQHLNGKQALIFARSRSYYNGDFQRTANQRLLVGALLGKVMNMTRFELAPVMEHMSYYLSSDMTVEQMEDYAILFQDFAEELHMYSTVMPYKLVDVEEGSYVVCDTTLLQQVMNIINEGGDPSHLVDDGSVTSSEEAEAMGAYSVPVYYPEL